MAVTLTDIELSQAIGVQVDDTPLESPLAGIVGRLLGVGTAIVTEYLPDTTGADYEHLHNEGVIRIGGWLYRNDPSRNRSFADVLERSGALSLLSPFRVQRALAIDGAVTAISNATGIDPDAVLALISDWAHVGNTDQIPADKLGNAGGMGGSPLLVATVDITNAQIKNLDTAYIELLPAPAASEYLKIDQMWFHKFGADAPTITSSSPTPNAASLNHYTNYIIAMLITNPAATLPLGGDRTDYIWVYGSDLQQGGELLRAQPYLDGASVGGHGFSEGTALVLGLVASPARYSAAAWDEFIGTVNDVSMRISVFYSIHSRPAV